MEDLYVKPGNQERGWNDPPQFSYGLQTAPGGPKRSLLNKRVAPPQQDGSQSPVAGMNPPPKLLSTPPMNPLTPPPCGVATPPRSYPVMEQSDTSPSQPENEPNIDDVITLLSWALTACRCSVKKQVCDDIERRMKLFEDMWRSEKLSLGVRKRMNVLVQEMKKHNWDRADEIHRALIVDHINEVGQWMVGVKRLIAETRTLSPELLNDGASNDDPRLSCGDETAAK
ncbi:steroid receptor RNA activator 1 [Scleropages formosus]|uniref:Steroid receptor RNA activator 1 n=1 Tax=Scleropages formosus TaxID=113540 RepID=A0A8C9WDU1_SCLFO|nr:steroid receptor RNA activator 1 [Scleropages formosus]